MCSWKYIFVHFNSIYKLIQMKTSDAQFVDKRINVFISYLWWVTPTGNQQWDMRGEEEKEKPIRTAFHKTEEQQTQINTIIIET